MRIGVVLFQRTVVLLSFYVLSSLIVKVSVVLQKSIRDKKG